jgi:type I restriction enzyme S subunit
LQGAEKGENRKLALPSYFYFTDNLRYNLSLDSFKYAFDQHMSICRSKPSVSVFLYQILSSTSGQEKIQALKTGSTGMTMFNISKLREYPIIWPGQLIIDQYFDNVKNLFEKIAINDNQIRTLSSLRDSLLPRLISGQLRLPQLDEINNKTKVNA